MELSAFLLMAFLFIGGCGGLPIRAGPLERVGVTPEATQQTGVVVREVSEWLPEPFGTIGKVLGGGLVAGGAGWAAYRKRRREAQRLNNALRSVLDGVDAARVSLAHVPMPSSGNGGPSASADHVLLQALKGIQEARHTREDIRQMRRGEDLT